MCFDGQYYVHYRSVFLCTALCPLLQCVGSTNWDWYFGIFFHSINDFKKSSNQCRVPTAPGEMTTVFPVLEKYWNFIILLKILEKWKWTWKNEFSGEKIVLSWLLQHSFLALPIKMYTWEKFLDSWTSVVFSDGRVFGAIRLGMLLDSKKGDRASVISCPQCV